MRTGSINCFPSGPAAFFSDVPELSTYRESAQCTVDGWCVVAQAHRVRCELSHLLRLAGVAAQAASREQTKTKAAVPSLKCLMRPPLRSMTHPVGARCSKQQNKRQVELTVADKSRALPLVNCGNSEFRGTFPLTYSRGKGYWPCSQLLREAWERLWRRC